MAGWDVKSEKKVDASVPIVEKPISDDPWAVVRSDPRYKGRQGRVRAALRDTNLNGGMLDTPSGRMFNSAWFGLPGLGNAAVQATIAAARQKLEGGPPAYTWQDRFDAERLAANAKRTKFAGEHPLAATGLDIGGALMSPGSRTLGKWVVGSKAPALAAQGAKVGIGERALQTTRASTVGGALTGLQAATTAKPGEEGERAQEGALMGAVLAPVAGAALGVSMQGGQKLKNLALKAAGKRGPEVTSVEKLQSALRQAGVTPDAIEAASAEWRATGGVSPALLDIVRDSGGSSEVFRLLGRSTAKAPVRKMAEQYAEETLSGVQGRALEQAEALPTFGETRTPSRIRADLDAERTAIEADKAADLTAAEEARAAASREAPGAPRPRESGAAAFADELNKLYDASEKTYKQAYAVAEAAKPEAAVVDDAEVRPLFEKLRGALRGLNERLEGVGAVKKEIEFLKGQIAPGEAGDWPEGEVMELAKPLTVQDLEFLRQKMVELADKYGGATGGAGAARVKQMVDDELLRLSAEGKFQGDPEVVQKWREAIEGYAEHQKKFGSGLAATLTERTPEGKRAVEGYLAGEKIFGTGDKPRNLNVALSELEGPFSFVSPQAQRALQEELYGRVKIEDLAKLRETTGGKRLLPQDLTEEALAAREATRLAEEEALAAAQVAEQRAAARREVPDRKAAALEVGEGALSKPSEEFGPAVEGVEAVDLPIVASGAKQAVKDVLERPQPGATGQLNRLLSAQASKNLGAAVSPADVARMQARMKLIQKQAQGAQQLEAVTKTSALHTDPLIETITPGDIAYRERGAADAALKWLRFQSRLSEKEYEAALKTLASKDPASKAKLLAGLIKKYPSAKRAISPALVRPLAQESGDEEAVESLKNEYELE